VLERLLALGLIAVVAALYGVGADSDTYFVALIVPITLGISASEALYTALLPAFSDPSRPPRALLGPALWFAAALAATAAGAYVLLLVAVRPSDLAVWLLLAPTLFAAPVAGVSAAFLTAERRYALAILRVPLATALALAAFTMLHALVGWHSTQALALGISLGNLLALAVLVLQAGSVGRRPHERGAGPLAAGPLLSAAASVFVATLIGGQLVVVFERFLASTLAAGAVTLLVFARGFALLPVMIPQALASGVFPAASERHRALDRAALARLALRSVRLGVLAALVSAAFVVICRRELVHVAIERGKLSEAAAGETARLIVIMAVSLLGIAAAGIAGKALFAVGRQRVVAAISAAGVVVYVGAALLLRGPEGVDGLAAAFSLSSLVTGVALAGYLAAALELSPSSVLLDWLLAPALLAGAFAAGAVPGWLLMRTSEGVWASLATLVTVALAGAVTLAAAIVVARGYEYELLRGSSARLAQ
jgi:putative peptidoglycan lipid II flippase